MQPISSRRSTRGPISGERLRTDKFGEVVSVLESYISPMNARALLLRVIKAEGLTPETLNNQGLRRCTSALRRSASLFIPPAQLDEAMSAINDVCGAVSEATDGNVLELRTELDIGHVRVEARRICMAAQANAFALQKVATIVSELARNVIAYAGTGSLEINTHRDSPKRISIAVTDNGPGIGNLDEILAGRYNSKTGMGRGILGVKRLADKFDIWTDGNGTRVTAEVYL